MAHFGTLKYNVGNAMKEGNMKYTPGGSETAQQKKEC